VGIGQGYRAQGPARPRAARRGSGWGLSRGRIARACAIASQSSTDRRRECTARPRRTKAHCVTGANGTERQPSRGCWAGLTVGRKTASVNAAGARDAGAAQSGRRHSGVGADKAYDTGGLRSGAWRRCVEAHVAQKPQNVTASGRSNPACLHRRYRAVRWTRKNGGEVFGWFKTVLNFRQNR